jgi:hypothetical protein
MNDWQNFITEGVLEDLLETEELQDRKVHGRVEAEASFIRSDRGVELYAVTAVDLDLAFVVQPRNTEHDRALRLNNTIEDFCCLVFRILFHERDHRFGYFMYCLKEFRLMTVRSFHFFHESIDLCLVL